MCNETSSIPVVYLTLIQRPFTIYYTIQNIQWGLLYTFTGRIKTRKKKLLEMHVTSPVSKTFFVNFIDYVVVKNRYWIFHCNSIFFSLSIKNEKQNKIIHTQRSWCFFFLWAKKNEKKRETQSNEWTTLIKTYRLFFVEIIKQCCKSQVKQKNSDIAVLLRCTKNFNITKWMVRFNAVVINLINFISIFSSVLIIKKKKIWMIKRNVFFFFLTATIHLESSASSFCFNMRIVLFS